MATPTITLRRDQLEALLRVPHNLSPDWLRIDANFDSPARLHVSGAGRRLVTRLLEAVQFALPHHS
jgi:hypothetical protein